MRGKHKESELTQMGHWAQISIQKMSFPFLSPQIAHALCSLSVSSKAKCQLVGFYMKFSLKNEDEKQGEKRGRRQAHGLPDLGFGSVS